VDAARGSLKGLWCENLTTPELLDVLKWEFRHQSMLHNAPLGRDEATIQDDTDLLSTLTNGYHAVRRSSYLDARRGCSPTLFEGRPTASWCSDSQVPPERAPALPAGRRDHGQRHGRGRRHGGLHGLPALCGRGAPDAAGGERPRLLPGVQLAEGQRGQLPVRHRHVGRQQPLRRQVLCRGRGHGRLLVPDAPGVRDSGCLVPPVWLLYDVSSTRVEGRPREVVSSNNEARRPREKYFGRFIGSAVD